MITDLETYVDGYSVLCNDGNRQGEGICVFICEDLVFNPKSDLDGFKVV